MCQQCSREMRIFRVGLCRSCYRYNLEVQLEVPAKLPKRPTRHFPGTPGKIRVMALRASRREALHHPRDTGAATLFASMADTWT
jgi:hypothetical protein